MKTYAKTYRLTYVKRNETGVFSGTVTDESKWKAVMGFLLKHPDLEVKIIAVDRLEN